MEEEIAYSVPEYQQYEKGPLWYWSLGIGAALVAIIALIQNNFLFVLFIGIATALLISWGKRDPEMIDVGLSKSGARIGPRRFYPAKDLRGFAIVAPVGATMAELALVHRGRLTGWIKVFIPDDQVEPVRALLATYLPEVEYQESTAENLRHRFRF